MIRRPALLDRAVSHIRISGKNNNHMKIAIVNGSPRKGNTYTAINALINGTAGKHDIDIIEADKLNISGCKGCGVYQCHKGCVAKTIPMQQ